MVKTYYKTASLVANSCKGVGLLILQENNKLDLKYDIDNDFLENCFRIGQHLGMAF